MGDDVADDRWLAAEDMWMRWHVAVLVASLLLVAVRVVVVDASERPPAPLGLVAFAVSSVAAVLAWKTYMSPNAPTVDSWQVREDWKGTSRQDRREAQGALRARAPVRADLLRPAARLARHRALTSRGASSVPLMLTGQIVVLRLDGFMGIVAMSVVVLVPVMTWGRWEWVAQYRAVREQLDAVLARDDGGAPTSDEGRDGEAGDGRGPR